MQLRDVLGGALRVTRTAVELAAPIGCDAVEFLQAADQDPGRRDALRWTRFLRDSLVRQAPAFDEWAAEVRQRLVGRWTAATGRWPGPPWDAGPWGRRSTHATVWLEADPVAEEGVVAGRGIDLQEIALAFSPGTPATGPTFCAHQHGAEPGRSRLQLLRRIEADTRRRPGR